MSTAGTHHNGHARHSILPDLPSELLFTIHSFLDTKASFSLIQVNRKLYNTLSDVSYTVFIRDDPLGNYPLWWAVEKQNVKLARKALRFGAKPNEYAPKDIGISFGGVAPIMAVIETGCTPIFELLLQTGADLTTGANNHTAFTAAVSGRHEDIVLLFLQMPPPHNFVDSHDRDGNTALHVAAEEGYADLVQVLISHGARVGARNLKGCTPLHLALAFEGPMDENRNPVELLLKAGSDPLCKDFRGRDAIDVAREFFSNPESDRLFVNLKLVMAALQVSVDGQLRLSIPEAKLHKLLTDHDCRVVAAALEAGAPADTRDEHGDTALFYWAFNGNTENTDHTTAVDAISMLLEHGADVNARAPAMGPTALMGACQRGLPDVIELLLSKGADVNFRASNGMTALALVAAFGPDWNVKILLDHYKEHGKEKALREHLEYKDREGLTLLLAAIVRGWTDAAELLVEYGADVNAKDSFGRSAYDLSAARGFWDLTSKLREFGAHVDHPGSATFYK
ncbi:serine/threonine-protein phosphatase 6 regulatory ankyrin repeat subunit B [Microdochium nivale]|nr:serine/threonine-protein phosphatase 6 regulatory ankyrin repeat subunit B [Microdochium nivale]